ncbi:hypothetical protein L2Y96_00170 [Luteibacter aegosomaticola]|jgi:uncharacterized membrane protein|uniref:BufA2 family periplasmic bufferin-type metallophore n=1 Tax=Luteibacter aegosomaticola TaxID=2911538 RepID=UPI001FFC020E|nr:hypothetical protein [Luteibacter aegosomaticola]UPG90220.1 hypothetical protein L2Y96_00170 [Luteibacter aegosomaticola]
MNTATHSIAAAAAIFAVSAAAISAPVHAAEKAAGKTVDCYGINSCKGTSDCKSGNHACKGQNECKGQGFKSVSVSECKAQGGSTTPPAA